MSDLNSPEKPRSEPSLGGSQPHSWSDVTLIEDITQESLHRSLSAHGLGEYIPSSSESEVDQPSPIAPQDQTRPPMLPAQAVCVVKRFRLRSRSRGPALPVAPASDSTKPSHAPGTSDKPRLLPLSMVPRPSTGLPVPDPPAARRQLNEKTQDALGQAAELTASTTREFPTQNTSAAQLFRPSSEMVSASARGRTTQT